MDPKKNKKNTSNFRFSVGGEKGVKIDTEVSRKTANAAVLIATTVVVGTGVYVAYKEMSRRDALSSIPMLSA